MPTFSYEKVVRNGIPLKIARTNGEVVTRPLSSDEEGYKCLLHKLVEEVVEAEEAPLEQRAEELADAEAVLVAAEALSGVAMHEFESTVLIEEQQLNPEKYVHFLHKVMQGAVEAEISPISHRMDRLGEIRQNLLMAIAVSGVSYEDIAAAGQAKSEKNGGFLPVVYIESVTLPEEDPWVAELRSQPGRYPELPE